MRHIGQDVRFAWRTFRRRPVLTAAIVVTLALGIGANAAIFSVTKAVLLERLPYTDPSRLVMVWEDESALGFPRNTPAPGNYADWASSIRAFDGVAALDTADFNLTGGGEPEKIGGARVTANLFSVLGVEPMIGRVWRLDEERSNSRLAVLNYSVWVRSLRQRSRRRRPHGRLQRPAVHHHRRDAGAFRIQRPGAGDLDAAAVLRGSVDKPRRPLLCWRSHACDRVSASRRRMLNSGPWPIA